MTYEDRVYRAWHNGKAHGKNLLKAGHEVVVYDIIDENVEILAADGAIPADSARKVAEQCGVVITMLPNSPCKDCSTGERRRLEGAGENTILIDMSSIAPKASQDIAKACAEKGIRMLDAPVSGGEPKAVDGTLSIMVGGDKELFEQVKHDILLKMGSSAVWCGDIGAGNTTKLANQVIVALNIAAVAEAFTLAKKSGVKPELVFDAIRGGLAGSTVMDAKVPMMLEGNKEPGFKIDLHIKDLANALDTGHEAGSPMPLAALVMEMMQTLKADGLGQKDHSALSEYYAKLSGTELANR